MRVQLTAKSTIEHAWSTGPALFRLRAALTRIAKRAPREALVEVDTEISAPRGGYDARTTIKATWSENL